VSAAAIALRDRAQALQLSRQAPRPILLGRHLIAWGLAPGKTLGPILEAAFEAQLDGEFQDLDGARQWYQKWSDLHMA
jgi:tRNA nucleotidyltransferase (CCA-adding enzyme)